MLDVEWRNMYLVGRNMHLLGRNMYGGGGRPAHYDRVMMTASMRP